MAETTKTEAKTEAASKADVAKAEGEKKGTTRVRVAVPKRAEYPGFYAAGVFLPNGTSEVEIPNARLEEFKRDSQGGFYSYVELGAGSSGEQEGTHSTPDQEPAYKPYDGFGNGSGVAVAAPQTTVVADDADAHHARTAAAKKK